MTVNPKKPEWAQSRGDEATAEQTAGPVPKRRILPWLLLTIAVAGATILVMTRPEPEAAVSIGQTPIVKQIRRSETTQVSPSNMQQTIKVSGLLAPARQSDVAAQAGGQVLSVEVRPGDTVREGDIIAQIDTESLLIQLEQQQATAEATRAQLVLSEQQLQRTEELAKQGLNTPSALEEARSSAAALRANLVSLENVVKSAQLALDNATVRAPISGIVSSRSVEPGQTVAIGASLVTIVNIDSIEYQASASMSASTLVEAGQSASITVSGLEHRTFTGTVVRVGPVAASGTRAVQIYVSIKNADHALRGGMFATGSVTVSEKHDVIALPSQVLREDSEGSYVLVLEGQFLQRRAVEPGMKWDRGRMIELSGVNAGDVIVSAALAQLSAADPFKLIED
ncbi:RND transporter [Devosia yakushimensis]|uniref:RND transporter n=1 Tax=Devosia yakushimensis TaxID=470028 RepID=A0ABQ5UH90_9HYPH|nr:efflux RND transporter periplasmic adaptor subunit [Devosia yakushimensis]GLQ11437.1 RND transporter [Devosia yakushimensis]